MAKFTIGKPIETTVPSVEVTVDPEKPLAAGKHRFQLIVVDDTGNQSLPDEIDVVVKDLQKPTAVIKAPSQVDHGQSFTLDGSGSSDIEPGKIVKYIWTLVE